MSDNRTYETRKDLMEAVTSLFATALTLNRKDFHIFVYGSGHIAEVKIQAYAGGWEPQMDYTHQWHITLDNPEYPTVDEVKEVEQELIKASEENDKWQIQKKEAKEKRERAEYERLRSKYA